MKTGTMLVATLALASFPLVAQQSAPDNSPSSPPAMQPNSPAGPQSSSPAAEPERADPASAAPATAGVSAPADLRAVKGELVSKLDTKTAKTGDDVVVQTNAAVKTADGTEIPKGSKLVGHVLAVQASTANQNSQVVLLLDHAELKGGQSLPIQSQIQSIGEGSGNSALSDSAAMSEPSTPSATSGTNGTPGSANSGAANSSRPTSPTASPAATTAPAAGTVVARTGNITIRATSIPGVLLANNEPGQRDPRMAQASSILLGAQRDVQLSSGTPVVVGVSAAAK